LTSKERNIRSNRQIRLALNGKFLWAQLMVAACFTSHAHAAPNDATAVSRENRPATFHARVQGEMEAALGAPIRTHQDAINAAYLSVGWTWGADTPDELDDAAYRKAWRWGFRIEAFAQSRRERFSRDELADAPLRAWDGLQVARTERKAPAPLARAPEPRTPRVPTDPDRIESVERRVREAQAEVQRITAEIDSLERRAHDPLATQREQEARRAELDVLNHSLEQAQTTLASLQSELYDVTRELAAK
jgi:hypothetical protein